MKLFIDSSQKIFFAAIFENNQKIYSSKIETQYKVEEIISFFNNVSYFDQINEIYINLGPGSFTGSRISLLYVRTLAQLKNIKIFVTSTFELLSSQSKKKLFNNKFYIYATKNKSYSLKRNEIKIVDKNKMELNIDYDKLIQNFSNYLSIFNEIEISKIQPIYVGNPQIGDIKK